VAVARVPLEAQERDPFLSLEALGHNRVKGMLNRRIPNQVALERG